MLRQFRHIPSKCIDKGFLRGPAATRTTAARAWPTHPAEEMQIFGSKPEHTMLNGSALDGQHIAHLTNQSGTRVE